MNTPQPPPQIQETGRLKALKVPSKLAGKVFVGVLLVVAAMAFLRSFTVPGALKQDAKPVQTPANITPREDSTLAEKAATKRIQDEAALAAAQNRGTGLYTLQGMLGQGQQPYQPMTTGSYPYTPYQPASTPYNEAADRKAVAAKLQEEKEEAAFKASKARSIVSSFEEDYRPGLKDKVDRHYQRTLAPVEQAQVVAVPAKEGPEATGSRQQMYTLYQGTWIETTLANGLHAGFTGPFEVKVGADVYDFDRTVVLIKTGATFMGMAEKLGAQGQERVATRFTRLLRQDKFSLEFPEMPGLSQSGETGLKDKVNHHYVRTFTVTAVMGLISGFALANTQGGYSYDGEDAYRQGVSSAMARSATRIMDYFLHLPWDVTIRPGWRVMIFIMKDMQLPAQEVL